MVRLFGPLAVAVGERVLGPRDLGRSRPKQGLEILLAHRGHPVPTERLAELLWGAERPQNAGGSLQTFVSVLRRHLGPDRERARELVVTDAEACRFATHLVELDLERFDELVERSAREPTRLARRSLEEALVLVRGDVLEDEPFSGWAIDLRGTYQRRVLGARLDAAEAALSELDYGTALQHVEVASGLDRFSERAYRLAMLALTRSAGNTTRSTRTVASVPSLTRSSSRPPRRARSRRRSSTKKTFAPFYRARSRGRATVASQARSACSGGRASSRRFSRLRGKHSTARSRYC